MQFSDTMLFVILVKRLATKNKIRLKMKIRNHPSKPENRFGETMQCWQTNDLGLKIIPTTPQRILHILNHRKGKQTYQK